MSLFGFRTDEGGNMSVLFAFGFTISAMVSAVAVDAAALYQERRQLQAGVDMAAISAATDPSRATEIARSVLVEARLLAPAGTEGLSVVTGHYDPDIADIAARFQPGASPVNAVSVALQRTGTLHFAGHFTAPPSIAARGVAALEPEVSFSLGSRLGSLNNGLANTLLSTLLGTTVSLSVLDYSALAGARVDALAMLDALALELGVTAGTYDDLLDLEAPSGSITAALARVTTGTARTALGLIGGSGRGHAVPLGRLFSLGRLGGLQLGSGAAVTSASLTALEMISATAALADGEKQVAVALGAGVPGLAGLWLDLAVGEPPQGGSWFAIGPAGTVLRTAQVRLRLRASLLGGAVLLGAGVHLPMWVDLAYAEARVAEASCPSPTAPRGSAVVEVRPGVLRLAVSDIGNDALHRFGTNPPVVRAQLVDALLIKVSGSALAQVGVAKPVRLTFFSGDIAGGLPQTARTGAPVASLAGSLFSSLDLSVSVLGIGLSSPSAVAQAVRGLLAGLAPTLDLVIEAMLSTLGLGIGEADVRVYGVRCSAAVLVG